MANPTNVNVPPAKAADPTNINVPVHGTKFPSGVTGADQVVELSQGSDLGNGVTNSVVDSWIAPFDGYIREYCYQTISVAATCTFNIFNNTTSTSILGSTTPTSNTAANGTSFASAAAQSFSKGDEIQLRVTTSGGSGASKGLQVKLFLTPTAGSTTNPL